MLHVPNPDLMKAMAHSRGVGLEDPLAWHMAELRRHQRLERQARRRERLEQWWAMTRRVTARRKAGPAV